MAAAAMGDNSGVAWLAAASWRKWRNRKLAAIYQSVAMWRNESLIMASVA